MLKNFLNRFGYISRDDIEAAIKAQLPRWLLSTAEAEQWTLPPMELYTTQAELYQKLDDIATAVDIVASTCTDADIDVIDGAEKEDDKHKFIQLLQRPNGEDSRTEFLKAHFAYRMINGNSYWFLNRRDKYEPPDEVWILPPDKVRPVPDGRMGLKGYVYSPGNGEEIPLDVWEIVHFKSFNPFSRYIGLSLIESLAVTAYGAKSGKEWNTKLFAENNGKLAGIIAFSDMVQDADWTRMKKEVRDSSNKRDHMMLRGVGKGGVEWIQASLSQREMEFLAGLEASKQSIYDRIAPGLYNMMTSNSSLASGKTGEYLFMKMTISPLLHETADKLNNTILPMYGDGKIARYDEVVPRDRAQEVEEIKVFALVHTIDEIRMEKYKNKAHPDPEVGKLLISQLGSAPQKKEDDYERQGGDEEEAVKYMDDLRKWQRKAVKNVGNADKMTSFESDLIPFDVSMSIREALKACNTENDVRQVFATTTTKKNDILYLAETIEKAVNAAN
jgi:HK97 family phage portal protein